MPECAARQWTLASLRERAGENQVFVRRNTNQASYRTGRAYNVVQMPFSESVARSAKDYRRRKIITKK